MDNGYGALYKIFISQIQDQWLKWDKNIDLWLGNSEKKLTASVQTILITHWVSEAHERLQWADYNKTRYRCFEKTGCLMTATVTPEGLINYIVPKPLPARVSGDAISCPVPEPAPEPEDIIMDDNDQFPDENVPNDDEQIDDKNDCEYDHIMVNHKIYALYDNEWHQGTIQWHNSTIDQYWVLFPDGTNDYIKIDDIDVTGVKLEK